MKRSWFATPYVVWMVMFTLMPLLFMLYFAFTGHDGRPTIQNIVEFFDPVYLSVLWRSLYLAFFCTMICLMIGYPAAAFLASKDFEKNNTLFVLILVPMWMNFLLRTYAMMSMMEDRGIINNLLVSLGFERLELIGTEGAVLVGMVYNMVPFMIMPIYTALKKMDRRVIEAAEDLGANPLNVFLKVTLPLSIPGVISGITMVFMPAVTTFAISRLLGSGNFWLFGDLIEHKFLGANDWNFGSALSLIMMILILVSFGFLNKADAKQEGGGAW